jgi:hypothetical protein
MTSRAAAFLALMVALAAQALQPSPATAQGVRGTLYSTANYVELRPLARDTIDRALVTQREDGSFFFEGLRAECGATTCTVYRTGPLRHGLQATHDADLTAWGFGVQGLSATVLLRGRTHLSGDFRMPRSDEEFEAVLAYAELARGIYRVRAGRQRAVSGLGFSGFDGLDVLVEPSRRFHAQAYVGRSLARAVQQPLSQAFRAIDERDFVRDRDAWLLGAEAGFETTAGSTIALRYQGEIWSDRAGLLSERALLVGRTVELRPFVLSASAEYDVGFGRFGKAHIDAQAPLPIDGMRLEATVRRYVPFFEYWTIWGLFSPVAYHEVELRTSYAAGSRVGLWGSGGYRRYEPHNTQTFLRPLEGQSWRGGAGAQWQLPGALSADAAVRVEGPVGAFTLSSDAALQWRATPRLDVSAHGLLLQQIEEFRVGAGAVVGGGLGADFQLRDDLHLAGGFALYRQTEQDRPGRADWTQRRGWLSVRVDIGREPGLPREDGS